MAINVNKEIKAIWIELRPYYGRDIYNYDKIDLYFKAIPDLLLSTKLLPS
jgi:hypothetical protein